MNKTTYAIWINKNDESHVCYGHTGEIRAKIVYPGITGIIFTPHGSNLAIVCTQKDIQIIN